MFPLKSETILHKRQTKAPVIKVPPPSLQIAGLSPYVILQYVQFKIIFVFLLQHAAPIGLSVHHIHKVKKPFKRVMRLKHDGDLLKSKLYLPLLSTPRCLSKQVRTYICIHFRRQSGHERQPRLTFMCSHRYTHTFSLTTGGDNSGRSSRRDKTTISLLHTPDGG